MRNSSNDISILIRENPGIENYFKHIPTGDYTLAELYEFNQFEKPSIHEDVKGIPGEMVGEPGEGICVGMPIVQLDEMYKASLIVKSQICLLVRLFENNLLSLF